jgi:hypothetical protein
MKKLDKDIKYFIHWLHWQNDLEITHTQGSKSKRSMIFTENVYNYDHGYSVDKKRTLDYMYNYWLTNIKK